MSKTIEDEISEMKEDNDSENSSSSILTDYRVTDNGIMEIEYVEDGTEKEKRLSFDEIAENQFGGLPESITLDRMLSVIQSVYDEDTGAFPVTRMYNENNDLKGLVVEFPDEHIDNIEVARILDENDNYVATGLKKSLGDDLEYVVSKQLYYRFNGGSLYRKERIPSDRQYEQYKDRITDKVEVDVAVGILRIVCVLAIITALLNDLAFGITTFGVYFFSMYSTFYISNRYEASAKNVLMSLFAPLLLLSKKVRLLLGIGDDKYEPVRMGE